MQLLEMKTANCKLFVPQIRLKQLCRLTFWDAFKVKLSNKATHAIRLSTDKGRAVF